MAPLGMAPARTDGTQRRTQLVGVATALTVAAAGAVILLWPDAPPRGDTPGGAVEMLFRAYQTGSCTDFFASTTPRHQGDPYVQITDCTAFAAAVDEFAALGDTSVEVTAEVPVGEVSAQVEALETYRIGTAEEYRRVIAYRVKLVDGSWRVDHFDLTVLPDLRP